MWPALLSRALISVAAAAVILAGLLGCDTQTTSSLNGNASDSNGNTNGTALPDKPTDESPTTKVEVQVAGIEDFKKLLDKRRGTVVLVDYWATW